MLTELEVRDLAVIRHSVLPLGSGMTVITGESGAGKSLLLRAVDLASGARADATLVREGETAAVVRLRFAEQGVEHELSREIRRDGRSGASVDGRAARLTDLRAATEAWLGGGRQGDAYRLRQVGALEWLDRLEPVPGPRAATAEAARAVEAARQALGRVAGDDPRAWARQADALRFAVEEIDAAQVRVGEREELRRERERLHNLQRLAEQAGHAREAMAPYGEGLGARDLLGAAEKAVRQAAALDPDVEPIAASLLSLYESAQEVARDLERYIDRLVPDPAREEEVAVRLDLLADLSHKYGETEGEILAYADEARAQLARYEAGAGQLDALRAAVAAAEAAWRGAATELSAARRTAARTLEVEAADELRRLALPEARLFLRVDSDPGAAVSPEGMDRVEVLFAANAGSPLLPLSDAASGGETSRVLLALEAVLAKASPGATWLFDEVEAGVGGSAAWDVAQALWALSRGGQVLLVSHLAPVAACADVHLAVEKTPGPDGRIESRVRVVEGHDRVREIARMLSGEGEAAERHAVELLDRASSIRDGQKEGARRSAG